MIEKKETDLWRAKKELQEQNDEMNKCVRPDLIKFRKKYEKLKKQLAESNNTYNNISTGNKNELNKTNMSTINPNTNTSVNSMKNSNTSHDLFISKNKLNRH